MLHNLSTSIVNECREHGVGTIIIGDLKGIREDKDFGKQTNQQLHAWPFAKLTEMITYKAEEVGIEVVKVSERYTSRACCVCGVINKKSARTHRGLLECADCGAQIHADVNGAFNILRKYLLSHDANGIGVAGGLPTLPSPTARALGFGKFVDSQIDPTFVARFDLRNFSVKMTQIGQQKQSIAIDTSTMAGV